MNPSDNKSIKTDQSTLKNVLIIVFSGILGLGIGLYFKINPVPKVLEGISTDKAWSDLDQFHEELLLHWRNAEEFKDKKSLSCLQSKMQRPFLFSDQYLRCNVDFFNCLAQDNKRYEVIFLSQSKDDFWWRLVDKKYKDVGMQFLLKNNCHDVVVSEQNFESVMSNKKLWSFDTFGQKIIVDRYLSFSANDPVQSCKERGKYLFTAQLYDAMSLFPLDVEKKSKDRNYSFYPWTRKKKESFLYKLKIGDYKITEKDCRSAFVKDCNEFYPYKIFASEGTSLYGLGDVLGGPLEVFYNPLEISKNLKLSSFYFEGKSDVHEIGRRSEWDRILEKRQIGFRCFSYY